jgi:alpha-beta hydrolase superfamily lysophospholipase
MQRTLPGVVILQGSSANLRHEYRFFADHFARAGFAVLVFDKRGHGGSEGDYGNATYRDLAGDATAALARLRAEPQVARSRVGLWGLSQGALLAPMVAAAAESLAFVVAVSAPGVSTGECSAYQDSVRVRDAGFGSPRRRAPPRSIGGSSHGSAPASTESRSRTSSKHSGPRRGGGRARSRTGCRTSRRSRAGTGVAVRSTRSRMAGAACARAGRVR